jgi:hypothetical protein
MAKVIDLYIDQGSDFTATFPPVTDNTGSVVDLTGYTAACYIRRSYATEYAVAMTIDDSRFDEGIITIGLSNTETAGLINGLIMTRWVYDVAITETVTGDVTKVFEGLATVNPSVTSKPDTILLSPYIPEDYGGL